jgi:g-D-glutamyl-meso-diaminopimelate peptidase
MKKLLCMMLVFSLQFGNVSLAKVVETNSPYTYEEMKDDLEKLNHQYRAVKVKKIGETHFGRDIYAIRLGKGKKNIVLIGAHHGREWITSMLLMNKLEVYADLYQRKREFGTISTDILNDVSIWFIPMLNPDGVTIQQNKLNLFPKKHREALVFMNAGLENFERWKANGVGVDLNRQYPAGWKELTDGPQVPFYQFYKGKRPLATKEIKAVTAFIHDINPEIAVAYHSAGREIFWNYKNGKQLKRDKQIAKKISTLTGYPLAKPPKHATGGGFTDWFITTYHRPAMTIEVSPLVGETSPPLSVFKTEWERNKYVGLTLAEEAKHLKRRK